MANQQAGGERPSEKPSPSPSPNPSSEAASSPASAPASAASEGAPGFIGDPGPAFDAEHASAPPPAPGPEQLPPAQLIEWEEDTVRALLTLKGRAMHAGIGVAEQDWRYTEVDLAAIAPPLTRIANRYEPIQRLAVHADPLLLLFAFGGYGVRSLEERAAVMRLLAEESDVEEIEAAPPAEVEALQQQPQAPSPETAPRQTQWSTSVQGPPPPAAVAAPVQEAPPAPAARPGEADVDPNAINWDVPRQ